MNYKMRTIVLGLLVCIEYFIDQQKQCRRVLQEERGPAGSLGPPLGFGATFHVVQGFLDGEEIMIVAKRGKQHSKVPN